MSPPISSHEPRGDRQAEPGAAVAARRRRVGLRERLEQPVASGPPGCRCRCRGPRSVSRCASGAARLRRRRVTTTSPRSVNLTALDSRLSSTCRSRVASPTMPAGTPSSTRQPSSSSFSAARGRDESSASSTQSRRSNGCALELELAGLDLREVEDVVDDVQQRVAARRGRSRRTRAARRRARCRAAGRSSRSRRSSACGSRGSSWPGTRSSPGSPPPPPRAHARAR